METTENQSDFIEEAKLVLEKLLSLLGISASVAPSAEFPVGGAGEATASAALDIEGEDLGILIGRRGQTLAALQYIVRLIVGQKTQIRLPILIDVEGYKRRRCEAMRALAVRIAEQVKVKGTPFTLEPMPAFERRIIHVTLADDPDVTTESTGFGEARKVVVKLRDSQPD